MAPKKEETNINGVLSEVGVLGRYHLNMFFWTFIVGMVTAFQTIVVPYTQGDMRFRCVDHGNSSNASELSNIEQFNNTCPKEGCEKYEYDQSMFQSTIVSEFDLVCSRASYPTISNMVFSGTNIVGGMVVGALADRFGRRPSLLVHLGLMGVIGVITAWSVSIEMYILFRVFVRLPSAGVYHVFNTLLSEVTAPVKRPHLLLGIVMSWSCAILLLTGIAYGLRDWTHLQIVVSAPAILLMVVGYWVFDESPHWLCSKGRIVEAQKVVNRIAEWNNCTDKDITIRVVSDTPRELKGLEQQDSQSEVSNDDGAGGGGGCMLILKSRRFLAIMLICSLGWLACNLGYHGMLIGIGSLVGNLYVNTAVGGAAEQIAYALCFLILVGGRKKIYVALALIGGLSLISAAVCSIYSAGTVWLIVTLTMIGRLCISAAWQVLYVWCLELFPTSVRVTMLQIALTSGYAGAVIGPLLADIHKLVTDPNIKATIIAPITYSVLLLLSGLASLYLPETNNRPLPVTISDALAANQRKATSDDSIELKDHQARL